MRHVAQLGRKFRQFLIDESPQVCIDGKFRLATLRNVSQVSPLTLETLVCIPADLSRGRLRTERGLAPCSIPRSVQTALAQPLLRYLLV
jgi:hypothetical protein